MMMNLLPCIDIKETKMICDTGKCTSKVICDDCKSVRVMDLRCKCGKKHRTQVGNGAVQEPIECSSLCKEIK